MSEMDKVSNKDFVLKIPTQSTNLKIIRDFITDIARKAGFDELASFDIALAVDEACTNVIKHAYRGGDDKEITVKVRYDSDKIIISISDTGKGFKSELEDEAAVKKRLNSLQRGGLGIFLMKKTMDEVVFDKDSDLMNSVKMTKYLH
ncbi:ATP-binding protein [Candidatus Marinimicrobia bacterium MT.SAG.4]|nr:ATP-binding protein [Candidatus Marinimicrobia bacterium MT.SAG.4]